jgi:predicted Zn-dependent protease
MKRPLLSAAALLVLVMPFVSFPVYAQQDDPEIRAMRDEMQRSMKQLHLESMAEPYYIAYKISDTDQKEEQASLGALTSSGESRNRFLSVTVRVGSYDFDNTNFTAAGGGLAALLGSIGAGSNMLPIDDSYDEMRRRIWLATDAAYKKAVEDLSAKKAAQQSRNRDETILDFCKEPARQESEIMPPVDLKLPDTERLVRAASAVFRTLPLLESSSAEIAVSNTTEHFLDSEGTTYVRQLPDVNFRASASIQIPTGEIFTDSYTAYGRSLTEFPPDTALLHETNLVVDRLNTRRKGKVAKRYNGPVLFEGDAAAELFAHNFANQLAARRANGSGNSALISALLGGGGGGAGAANTATNLINKIGSRLLPDFLTVIDNPQLTQADGHPLFGNYKFDEEGVPSQETVLVKDGYLKTLLTSRTPARGLLQSTGNMRERGVLPGNLFLDASKTSPAADLRKQLLDLVKGRDLEYGMIIRRLTGNVALEAIRVYPDGHEETVRDARIAEVTINSFKDILAVSKERAVYTEHAALTSLAGFSPFSGGDLVTYVVPDLLFEDMTVEHIPNDSPKLPAIPSPLAQN